MRIERSWTSAPRASFRRQQRRPAYSQQHLDPNPRPVLSVPATTVGQVTTMLGLATPSAGKRAKEAAVAAAGGVNGSSAGGGGGSKQDTPNEVFQRWCGRLLKALGKCFAARA